MRKEELKAEENLSLDEISRLALDKLLHGKDSTIRTYEKNIANVVQNQAEQIKSGERTQDTTSIIEDAAGKILDITDEMNHNCFKAGMCEGAKLILELLQVT